MSEKSFSCKDCNKVTIENGCKTHVYENLYDSGYCLDCFFNDCESDDEEHEECVICGCSHEEPYANCDSCQALFCNSCDEDEDERFITHSISIDFCTDKDACKKRRIQQLIDDPSRYRHPEDKEDIAKLENLS